MFIKRINLRVSETCLFFSQKFVILKMRKIIFHHTFDIKTHSYSTTNKLKLFPDVKILLFRIEKEEYKHSYSQFVLVLDNSDNSYFGGIDQYFEQQELHKVVDSQEANKKAGQ